MSNIENPSTRKSAAVTQRELEAVLCFWRLSCTLSDALALKCSRIAEAVKADEVEPGKIKARLKSGRLIVDGRVLNAPQDGKIL